MSINLVLLQLFTKTVKHKAYSKSHFKISCYREYKYTLYTAQYSNHMTLYNSFIDPNYTTIF